MTPEEADQLLKGKTVAQIHFDENQIELGNAEILSIEFTDGTRLSLGGGYNGEVTGGILIDGVEDGSSININPMDIIKKLAESDPTYESGMGDLYCVFCGPLDYGEAGEMVHSKDCIWLVAKKLEK